MTVGSCLVVVGEGHNKCKYKQQADVDGEHLVHSTLEGRLLEFVVACIQNYLGFPPCVHDQRANFGIADCRPAVQELFESQRRVEFLPTQSAGELVESFGWWGDFDVQGLEGGLGVHFNQRTFHFQISFPVKGVGLHEALTCCEIRTD